MSAGSGKQNDWKKKQMDFSKEHVANGIDDDSDNLKLV